MSLSTAALLLFCSTPLLGHLAYCWPAVCSQQPHTICLAVGVVEVDRRPAYIRFSTRNGAAANRFCMMTMPH